MLKGTKRNNCMGAVNNKKCMSTLVPTGFMNVYKTKLDTPFSMYILLHHLFRPRTFCEFQ